jgi:DNA ligase-1
MKPLLAEKVDLDNLTFPYLVSPKYDGFRCLVHPNLGVITRSLKPVPNVYVRGKLSEWSLSGLDGELLTLTGGKVDEFNVVQSKLSSRSGMPDFVFKVFDCFDDPRQPFELRLNRARDAVLRSLPRSDVRVEFVQHEQVDTLEELLAAEDRAVTAGWEGLMLRSLDGVYKFGRSTVKERILLKLKRFDDDEGEVVGTQERMHNANEAKTSDLGYTERSSHRANMVPTDTLGALTLRWRGVEFDVGTGFDMAQRVDLWGRRESLVGQLCTFSFQGVGSGGRPRFPRFRGLRAKEDVS